MDDDYTCSISTHAITEGDIGQWNCDLQSFPFADVSLIYLLKVSCVPFHGTNSKVISKFIFDDRKHTMKTRYILPLI